MPPKNGLLFYYVGVSGSIAANASSTLSIQLDTGTYFKWMGTLGSSSLDTSAMTRPANFSVLPSLKSLNVFLANSTRIPQSLFCGTAENPLWLPNPVILNPGEIFNFDLLNLQASSNIVTIALLGYKLNSASG